jgi:uncharacterized protein YbaR (Trm112 family)
MKNTNETDHHQKRYVFQRAPPQPGNPDCDDCYGNGWSLHQGTVKRCNPCDVYTTDKHAANAAAASIQDMYTQLRPDEELVIGHGHEPFVLHPLPDATDACPECDSGLTAIEAGYDRYGTLSLEDRVLWIEDAGFSDDGNGPHYLHCHDCNRAYAIPKGGVDYR